MLIAISAASIFAGLADASILLARYQSGRPSDTGYAWLVQLIGMWTELDFAAWFPAFFRRFYAIDSLPELLGFLGAAAALNLALGLGAGLLALPLAARIHRRPGLALVFSAPFFLHLATEVSLPGLTRSAALANLAVGVGIVAALWLLLWPMSRIRSFPALSRACAAALMGVGMAAIAGGALAGLFDRQAATVAVPKAPNILLISIDSLRADHLHCYGYPRETSPHLDALAAEGVLYRYAVAPTSWTLPSHVTMMTSLPPHQHQITSDLTRLGGGALTLAEVLRGAGYETAAFVSGPYLQAEYGFWQGFDHYDDYSAMPRHWNAGRKITSPGLINAVTRWIEDRPQPERPFFVFLHMWDVHYDYRPPAPYANMFDPHYTGSVTGEDFEGSAEVHRDMAPRDLEHIIALYDGEIRYTDEHLGQLFDFLRRRGLFDSSIVAATSDHGDEFFEHGEKGHRKSLYDEVLLVPLILRYPAGLPAGQVISEQVRLLDLAPTLLRLAGLEQPPEFGMQDGDQRDFGQNVARRSDTETIEEPAPRLAYGVLSWQLASVRNNGWKLIVRVKDDPRPELYNLAADPGEQVNLSGQHGSQLDELHSRLSRFRRAGSKQVLAENMEASSEHLAALRSLGYLSDLARDAVESRVQMIAPPPGSRLERSGVTFRWQADGKTDGYYLKVGSIADAEDIFGGNVGSTTSARVSGIPLDGRDIHVRLVAFRGDRRRQEDFLYVTGDEDAPCTATVSLQNLTRGGAGFQVGDSFRMEVRGEPEAPVRVKALHRGRRQNQDFGRTDADGRLVIEDVMRADSAGEWRQTWLVGGRCASPTLSFEVAPAE